jgi:hypothetical protein
MGREVTEGDWPPTQTTKNSASFSLLLQRASGACPHRPRGRRVFLFSFQKVDKAFSQCVLSVGTISPFACLLKAACDYLPDCFERVALDLDVLYTVPRKYSR